MAQSRLTLHETLKQILGSNFVYFQPPESLKLQYPCIIYERSMENVKRANNDRYLRSKRYTVTVIDRNPDSDIPDKVGALPLCRFDRFFVADNLNHDIFNIYL